MRIDEMQIVNKKDDSYLTVFVNDFNDSYHRMDNEPNTDLEKAARKIRRRYKSFQEYRKAMAIYNEYMDILIESYGSLKYFITRLESKTVFQYIPPRPRLKKGPINNFIMKHNIIISDPNIMTIDSEKLEEYEETFEEEILNNTKLSNKIIKCKDKNIEKLIEETSTRKVTLKKFREIDAVELLSSYFDNANSKEAKEEKRKYEDICVADIAEGIDQVDDNDEDEKTTFFRGRMISHAELAQYNLLKDMNKWGWNSYKIMKQTKSKNSTATLALKQERRLEKKRKKKKGVQKAADNFLMNLMGDNDMEVQFDSFEDYENDMLNLTVNDVFK